MKQWRTLAAPSCFQQAGAAAPSPCPSPPREGAKEEGEGEGEGFLLPVRLVGCDGRVRAYRRRVTARELMQQHPRHLVCRADALLIGERIPAVAAGEELQPGQAYFLLPAHLFHSVLSFVSLASSLLLLLSTSAAAGGKGGGGKGSRPFELQRTASGTLRIKFSDDFLVGDSDAAAKGGPDAGGEAEKPAVLRGDERLEKEYEELVGYGKARRWAPKLETIQEVVAAATSAASVSSSSDEASAGIEKRKGRGLPFLGRLGSRRRREATTTTTTTLVCGNGSAVACSG